MLKCSECQQPIIGSDYIYASYLHRHAHHSCWRKRHGLDYQSEEYVVLAVNCNKFTETWWSAPFESFEEADAHVKGLGDNGWKVIGVAKIVKRYGEGENGGTVRDVGKLEEGASEFDKNS